MTDRQKLNEGLNIILDTNAFFVPLQFKIDVFSELERLFERKIKLILISPVKRELESLASAGGPKMRKDALYALRFSENLKYINIIESPPVPTDDLIVKIAKELNTPVFTNDKQLRKRLRDISVPVIYVRQKSRLEVDGMV
ncbi:nucleotide-binding protein [Candidatus Bathyarchaeota archaeon]|nr:nucleotide-binding protein [Candidatus Bathyarchaeota archaeon]